MLFIFVPDYFVDKNHNQYTPLKLTVRPENRPFAQFGKFDLPTIDFQAFQLAVDRFREGNPSNPFSIVSARAPY